jgi:hypothetical protein
MHVMRLSSGLFSVCRHPHPLGRLKSNAMYKGIEMGWSFSPGPYVAPPSGPVDPLGGGITPEVGAGGIGVRVIGDSPGAITAKPTMLR